MIHQLFLGNVWLLFVSQGIQEQLGADGVLGCLAGIFLELLAGEILRGQHGLEGLLVATELGDDLLDLSINLVLDHGFWQCHLGLLQGCSQHLVADFSGLGVLQLLFHLALEGLAELLQGVELGCQLGEVIVQLRKLALLHGTEFHGDLSIFIGVIASNQLGGEGLLFAFLHAGQSLIKALNQRVVADLMGKSLGGGFIHGLAIDGGGEIDGDEIAFLDLAIHWLQGSETSLKVLQLGVDCLIISLQGRYFNEDGREIRKLDLGAHVHLSGESDGLAILELSNVDLGLAESLDIVFLNGLAIARWQHLVDDLIQHCTATQTSLEDLGRNLSLAEARHVDLGCEGLVRLIELWLQLIERYLDG